MDVGARGVVEVPFVVVLTGDGRWLVEEVGVGRGWWGGEGRDLKELLLASDARTEELTPARFGF